MFKKPTGNSIKQTAINVTSATVGGMLSEGVVNLVPAKTLGQYEEIVRGGIALAAGVAAASIEGASTKAKAAQMFLAGMSIVQILKILPTLASKIGITQPTATSATAEKFIGGVFGLKCPCSNTVPNKEWKAGVVSMPVMTALNAASPYDHAGQKLNNFGINENQQIAANAFD